MRLKNSIDIEKLRNDSEVMFELQKDEDSSKCIIIFLLYIIEKNKKKHWKKSLTVSYCHQF